MLGLGPINCANHNFQLLLQLSIQNTWAHTKYMVRRLGRPAPGSLTKHMGLRSHTFCMGRWGRSEGSHTKYMGLGSLIHFVWGFLQLLVLKRDTFNSVDWAQPYYLTQEKSFCQNFCKNKKRRLLESQGELFDQFSLYESVLPDDLDC